jgi:GH43 family beta-xylosidase
MQPWTRRLGKLAQETVATVRDRVGPTFSAMTDPGVLPSNPPGDLQHGRFVNPIGEGADPSVVRDGDRFLWCQAEGNVGVAVWVSDRLTSLGSKHVVWMAEPDGPCSKEVWAPEIIDIAGRWHIYFAASDGQNRNHRTFVLAAETDDATGSYTLHGPLFTGDEPGGANLWSIDFTVLQRDGELFGIWSGWPDGDHDLQHLYIAAMASPTEIVTGRVCIAEPGAHLWERIDESSATKGLLEGPRILSRGDRTFVVYSCAASWLPTYKLGMLELTGADPLEPDAWTRSPDPVFVSSETTYGVGHGAYVSLGDEWWNVFHSKIDPQDGWRRTIHLQPMSWTDNGYPVLGKALPRGADLALPALDPGSPRRDACSWDLTDGTAWMDAFDYFGHHQFFAVSENGLELGVLPAEPVNDFRSAEKVVLRDGDFADVEVEATFSFVSGKHAVGILLRATGCAIGYAAQRGYFAALAPDRHALMIGKTDGATWTVIEERPWAIDRSAPQTLTVRAVGDRIEASSGAAHLQVRDRDYTRGTIGLRVVDTHARFTQLAIRPISSREDPSLTSP